MNRPPPTMTTLVFIPSPGTGNIVPALEFAKLLTHRDDRLAIKILLINFPFTPSDHIFASTLAESEPRIELTHLVSPRHQPPTAAGTSPLQSLTLFIESFVPSVRDILSELVSAGRARVAALVLSFFCLPMADVADELGIASYLFLASGLGYLSLMLNHQAISDKIASAQRSSPFSLSLPGVRDPIPLRVVLPSLFPGDEFHAPSLELARRFRRPRGIIVNSFKDLEPLEVRYLTRSGDGEEEEEEPPPIYMVGPAIDLTGRPVKRLMDEEPRENVMKWLDGQPRRSVLFLCFGSMGSFKPKQLREIAEAIERSGFRFLWFIRAPPQVDDVASPARMMLPDGFEERTRGRGLVVSGGWAPQAEVLGHVAAGGFVSHCGWNSVLESVWWGVPVATLPIGAEQPLNAFRMAREWGMAVEIRSEYYREEEVVAAEEIEAAVRQVMEEEESGEGRRRKVREMSERARKAVEEGGSSFDAVGRFISDVMASH